MKQNNIQGILLKELQASANPSESEIEKILCDIDNDEESESTKNNEVLKQRASKMDLKIS